MSTERSVESYLPTEFRVTPIAYLYLVKNGKILLVERNRGRLSDYHSMPAGHIEEGEEPSEAVAREAKEELGIDVIPSDVTFANLAYDLRGKRMILSFKIDRWKGEPQNMEPDVHKSIGRFPLSGLPENTTETARLAIRDILTGRFYRVHRSLPYPIV